MKYRVGIAAASIILVVALWSARIAENGAETSADGSVSAEIENTSDERVDVPIEASVLEAVDLEVRERRQEADDTAGLFGRVSPAEIEGALSQRIAEQSGLKLASLNAVDCGMRTCTIVFSGLEANPQYVGEYGDLLSALTNPPWKDYQPTSGSIGTREISPGAREYVIRLTYVAIVGISDDPQIAAHQHAACAGAWSRVTQQRGSSEYIQGAHERAAEWLELAANVLGLEEAQRLAGELQFGPLTRECHASPY